MSRELRVNRFTTTAQGLVPAPGSATGKVLQDDGNWHQPASAGGGSGTVTSVGLSSTGGTVTITGTNPVTGSGTINIEVASPSVAANITPDTHPTSTNWNDEFEVGASIDLTGARFSGANSWTWTNQLTATGLVTEGALVLAGSGLAGGRQQNIVTQSLSGAGSGWTYTCKFQLDNANAGGGNGGMILGSSGKFVTFGIGASANNAIRFLAQRLTNPTTVASTILSAPVPTPNIWTTTVSSNSVYLQITLLTGVFTFSASITGVPGSFVQIGTESLVTFLTTVTDIGLSVDAEGSATRAVYDWFRKTA